MGSKRTKNYSSSSRPQAEISEEVIKGWRRRGRESHALGGGVSPGRVRELGAAQGVERRVLILPSYYYMCLLKLLYMCPHTTILLTTIKRSSNRPRVWLGRRRERGGLGGEERGGQASCCVHLNVAVPRNLSPFSVTRSSRAWTLLVGRGRVYRGRGRERRLRAPRYTLCTLQRQMLLFLRLRRLRAPLLLSLSPLSSSGLIPLFSVSPSPALPRPRGASCAGCSLLPRA